MDFREQYQSKLKALIIAMVLIGVGVGLFGLGYWQGERVSLPTAKIASVRGETPNPSNMLVRSSNGQVMAPSPTGSFVQHSC